MNNDKVIRFSYNKRKVLVINCYYLTNNNKRYTINLPRVINEPRIQHIQAISAILLTKNKWQETPLYFFCHTKADTLEVMSITLNAPQLWENREKYMHMEDNREEYDMCQAMREWAEEERTAGMRLGIKEGETLIAALMNKLFLDNRVEDAKLATADENVRKQFYKEYGITDKNV